MAGALILGRCVKASGPEYVVRYDVPLQPDRTGVADRAALANEAPRSDPLVPTVFHEDWWLKASTGGAYDEVTTQSGGKTTGRFPFVIRRFGGVPALCGMPPLTHFLGPAIDDGSGAACNRALRRAEITRDLLGKMPRTSGFYQKMHAGIPDMLVFQERLYDVSVQFTYEIAPADEKSLWQDMRDKTRNVIRRAQERFEVLELTDPAEFVHSLAANLHQKGESSHHSESTIRTVCEEALRRGRGRILAARTGEGLIAAAIFCIWDLRTTYYLLTTRSADAGNGAVSLLIWTAMLDSAAQSRVFDFDGVGTDGSVLFYTGFGGCVRPRYIASRYTAAYRTIYRAAFPFRRRPKFF